MSRVVCQSGLCAARRWAPAALQSGATTLGSLIYPCKSPHYLLHFPFCGQGFYLISTLSSSISFFAALLTLATKGKKKKPNHGGVKNRHEIHPWPWGMPGCAWEMLNHVWLCWEDAG